jgi:hypothetical protein
MIEILLEGPKAPKGVGFAVFKKIGEKLKVSLDLCLQGSSFR